MTRKEVDVNASVIEASFEAIDWFAGRAFRASAAALNNSETSFFSLISLLAQTADGATAI